MAKVGCYAVARGRKPGVYLDWQDCLAQVLNFNGAKYKKFLNPADAELWINANAGPSTVRSSKRVVHPKATVAPAEQTTNASVADITQHPEVATVSSVQALLNSAPRTEPAMFPPQPETRTTVQSFVSGMSPSADLEPIVVYTDGSCRGNGRAESTAGVGVWWGMDDPRNLSERCPGDQTNNRAELIAIIRVLEKASTDHPLEIRSDSKYSINCMTKWLRNWKMKGWRKPDGKPVLNVPLIQYADLLLEERRRVLQQTVIFKKVLAHSGIEGNEAADKLANQGAALPAAPEQDWNSLIREVRARMEAACSTAKPIASVPRVVTSPSKQASSSIPQSPVYVSTATRRQTPPPIGRLTTTSAPLSPKSPSVSRLTEVAVSTPAPKTIAELASSDVVHGWPGLQIAERELEIYANCVLDDDEFMHEAEVEGLCA